MKRHLHHLYRERRFVFTTAALLFTSFLLAGAGPADPGPLSHPGTAVLVALGLALLPAAAPAPRARIVVLALAAGGLGCIGFFAALTGVHVAGGSTLAAPGWAIAGSVWILLAALAYCAVTGPWLDRLVARRPTVLKGRAMSWSDIHTLWFGLVPTAGHEASYCDAAVTAIAPELFDPDELRVTTEIPSRGRLDLRLVPIELEPPFHIRAVLFSTAAQPGGVDRATVELSIVDFGDRRLLLVRYEPQAQSFSAFARDWLDDRVGRELDRRLTAVEQRSDAVHTRSDRSTATA